MLGDITESTNCPDGGNLALPVLNVRTQKSTLTYLKQYIPPSSQLDDIDGISTTEITSRYVQ